MPYFVYRVLEHPESKANLVTYVDVYPKYREARGRVREERKIEPAEDEGYCRLVFANNQVEAEKILTTPRDPRVIGEDR